MLAMFLGKGGAQLTAIEAQNAYQAGCSQLSSYYNCDSGKVSDINTGITNDDGPVTFLMACRNHFSSPAMSASECVRRCAGCQGTGITVTAGKTCSDKSECDSVYTKDWECNSGHDVSGSYCCPSGQRYCEKKRSCTVSEADCLGTTGTVCADDCRSVTNCKCGTTDVGTTAQYCHSGVAYTNQDRCNCIKGGGTWDASTSDCIAP